MNTSLVTTQKPANSCSSCFDDYNPQPVEAFLNSLDHRSTGGVTEIRIISSEPYLNINGRRTYVGKTVVGYYEPDHYAQAAQDIACFDGQAQIYVCLNPCRRELLARAANRLQLNAQHSATDADITCLQWFRVDCDPVRPSGISASDAELKQALHCRDAIAGELESYGAEVIKAMSGNGGHLLIRLPDYPNDEEHRALVEEVTKDLAAKFSDDAVDVDTSVTNPARIWKLYGTLAVKGDAIPERPHRRASIKLPGGPPAPFDLRQFPHLAISQVGSPVWESANPCDSFPDSGSSAYALAALHGEEQKIRSTPDGQKHNQLLRSATALGGFVSSGELSESEIEATLMNAVQNRAADPQKARKTLRDGIAYGKQRPRAAPENQSPANTGATTPPLFTEKPQPLEEPLRPVPVLSPLMLPAPLRRWLGDIAERIACPLEFAAIPALIALASLIGRTVGIRPKRCDNWQVTPNLWGAIIGVPSALKTPASSEALRPLKRLAAMEHERYLEKHKKYQENKKNSEAPQELEEPVERRYIVNDATVPALGQRLAENPNGLLLYRDELPGFLKSLDREDAQTDRAFYLEAWNGNGENYVYDRVGRGTLYIPHVCLSIFGTIQPGPLLQHIRASNAGAQADGFFQRFQVTVWPDPVPWKNVDRWPDTAARNRAYAVFDAINNLSAQQLHAHDEEGCSVPFLRFTDDAQDFFDEWRHDLELKKLCDPQNSVALNSHLAKYRSLMPSLALLFHIVNVVDGNGDCCVANRVTLKCALAAAAWCDFLGEHTRRIYSAEGAECVRGAQIIADRLEDLPNPFTERDVQRKGWREIKHKDDILNALSRLEEKHWIKGVECRAPAGTNGGRPTRRYFVNPLVGQREEA